MGFVISSWKGEEKLWKVFWIYNILLGGVLSLAMEIFPVEIAAVYFAIMSIGIVWAIWVTVALWTCAFNSSWAGWGYLVRAMIVFSFVAMALLFAGLY